MTERFDGNRLSPEACQCPTDNLHEKSGKCLGAVSLTSILCEEIGDAGLARDMRITSTATFVIVPVGR
jgi:hypothetical protein